MKSEEEKIKYLKFLLKKKPFVQRWQKKALTYLLSVVAPKLASTKDYYDIENFHQIIKHLNEPFQPCANWIDNYDDFFVKFIIIQVRTFNLIRKTLA